MQNIKIEGKEINVEKFHFSTTYLGLLVGSPNEETNNKIISDYQHSLNIRNRKSVFHLTINDYKSKDVLKPNIYTAWLEGDSVNDPENEFHGSCIIVSWFAENKIELSIKQIIETGLSGFNYQSNAENYCF